MKFFLDSAKLDEIDKAYKCYGIDGVTTNPKHIMNSGKPFLQAITDIANWIKENKLEGMDKFPVSVEINPHLSKAEDMVSEAHKIAAICKNFVIKIPCNLEGLKAAKQLEEEGVRTYTSKTQLAINYLHFVCFSRQSTTCTHCPRNG